MPEKTIYELSSQGRKGIRFPEADTPEYSLPENLKREDLPLPESFDAVTKIIKKLESISLKKTDIQTVKDFFLKVLLNELGVEGDRDLHEKAEAYFQKQLWKLNMENLE